MPQLLEKTEFIGLRVPPELKAKLRALDARLRANFRDRNRLAPSYAHSLSVTARAALETGIQAMEEALKTDPQNHSRAKPREKRG